MKASLLAIGSAGARAAEAVLLSAFSGVLERDDVIRITLLCAPEKEAARLRGLYAAYADLRTGWRLEPHTGLQPILTLRCAPPVPSLAVMAEGRPDLDLLQALFTSEETHTPAMTASPRSAAAAWASLLSAPKGVLAEALEDAVSFPTVICASIAEACGAAGAVQLSKALRARNCPKTGAVLFTGLLRVDDSSLAAETLSKGFDVDFLNLLGLPQDCRAAVEGPHLLHLLAVRAVDAFLAGACGENCFALADGTLTWDLFDPEGGRWGRSFSRMLAAGALWCGVYAPESRRCLTAPNPLRDRLNPWYNSFFVRRKLSTEQRNAAVRQIGCAEELLMSGAAFLRAAQASLPYTMRPSPAAEEARSQAAEHYEKVLRLAGQLALIRHDLTISGLADEHTVHRHGMADTEAEAAVREQGVIADALYQAEEEQKTLLKGLGVRMSRTLLRAFAEKAGKEYEDVRSQAEEAARRIDQAAAVASPAEMPRIDQARARLRRMERRVAMLKGKADRAAEDWLDSRNAPLSVPLAEEEETTAWVFWPPEWLDRLCSLPASDPRGYQKSAQSLLAEWPWTNAPARSVQESVLRDAGPQDVSAVLALLECLMRAVRGIH